MEVVDEELKNVKNWFDQKRPVLNIKTTNFIVFSDKRKKRYINKNRWDGNTTSKKNKFLGVMIKEDLKWKSC